MSLPQTKGSVVVANGLGGVTVISPTSPGQIFVLDSNDPKGAKFTDIRDLMPTQKIKMVASSSNSTKLQSYQQIMETSIPGENFNKILSIKTISYAQPGVDSYSVLITDEINSIIAEQSFSNNTSAECNMGALSNLPLTPSIIKFSIKKDNGPTNKLAYLLSVDIEMTP